MDEEMDSPDISESGILKLGKGRTRVDSGMFSPQVKAFPTPPCPPLSSGMGWVEAPSNSTAGSLCRKLTAAGRTNGKTYGEEQGVKIAWTWAGEEYSNNVRCSSHWVEEPGQVGGSSREIHQHRGLGYLLGILWQIPDLMGTLGWSRLECGVTAAHPFQALDSLHHEKHIRCASANSWGLFFLLPPSYMSQHWSQRASQSTQPAWL